MRHDGGRRPRWPGAARRAYTGLAAVLVAAVLGACGGDPPPRLVVRAGRLFDGTGTLRERQRVVVDRGTIVRVEPDDGELAAGPGVAVIDARGATVLPGLVASTAHVLEACPGAAATGVGAALGELGALLRGGVTTIGDAAAPRAVAIGLRRHVGTGRGRGPRLLVAGPLLAPAWGGRGSDAAGPVSAGAMLEASSPGEARERVRTLAEAGVDLVGVDLREAPSRGTAPAVPDRRTLCALVDEAHTQELRVVGYAASNEAWRVALDCGVDALDGLPLEPLTAELARRAAEARAVVAVPGPGAAAPPSVAGASASLAAGVRELGAAGAALALGLDACTDPAVSGARGLARLVAAGLAPPEALVAATAGGARLLGLGDALGRIAAGYRADLVVIDGRPDERIEDVQRVRRVVLDGVEQPLDGPRWTARPAALVSILGARLGGS